ncbi:hypothetical protein K469DRAFT_368277 [Zopfia rhizophila CBS 207.26]|uniref:Uncharacterized protein n=1 Tax=Zopfia rhizophila CBS 207.26 TaxID=1314779 RepID=A0A6A6EIT2_9PEZI|nr:hypothetical protein K469DRAFT_368277 [Zopfia rhizophila CBS 207.26]
MQAAWHSRSSFPTSGLSKSPYEKLTKLCLEYDTHIYLLAYRNGRFHGFVSTDETGQPRSPPGRCLKNVLRDGRLGEGAHPLARISGSFYLWLKAPVGCSGSCRYNLKVEMTEADPGFLWS